MFFRKEHLKHYLMLMPFFVIFLTFQFGPIVYGFGMSLTDWDGIHTPNYVGIENYKEVVESPRFEQAFDNLFKYILVTVPLGVSLSFALALLINSFSGRLGNVFRNVYFFPFIIPLFIAAAVWRWMLTPDYGIVNRTIELFGFESINWLYHPDYMVYSVAMVDIWRAAGFNMIIFLAGLKGIPDIYYEAAKVDGANTAQQIRHITVPLLGPVLFLVIVNAFISTFQIFDVPWLLSGSSFQQYGGTLRGMLFPVMDIMGRGFGHLRFGEASAYAFILMGMILGITVIQFGLRRYWNYR